MRLAAATMVDVFPEQGFQTHKKLNREMLDASEMPAKDLSESSGTHLFLEVRTKANGEADHCQSDL